MAAESGGAQPERKLSRKLMEQVMFGTGRVRRFTQDSPILPDVWLEYAKTPEERGSPPPAATDPESADYLFPAVKLLIAPYRETSAGDVRRELRDQLKAERKKKEWKVFGHPAKPLPRVVYNQTTVAATLHFEDLIRVVLPMTDWWARLDDKWLERIQSEEVREFLAQAIQNPERPRAVKKDGEEVEWARRLPPTMLWMIRVVGTLAILHRGQELPPGFFGPKGVAGATDEDWQKVVAAVAAMIQKVDRGKPETRVYSVSLNREATPTIALSTLAIKADAARLLFNISCRELAWAVVDCGIDAQHPAFRQRVRDKDGKDKPASTKPFEDENKKSGNFTRVVETYDFTQIDLLLDPDTPEQPELVKEKGGDPLELKKALKDLNSALSDGRAIDWKLIAPLLRVPHETGKYKPPGMDHGTHVAGILASDWRRDESDGMLDDDLAGVCPDLRLYDLRVLDEEGRGDEFAVMAALQFIRYLNATNDFTVVHGVNLSLSIPHDISNYACGRTPICDESERVVSSGVVVVAAAGNQGYRKYETAEGTTEAYNSISITDPGNADLVITVGATHRFRPHTYGVSYFSSRGPTGDGRSKPDLVAPGEKITAPLPGNLVGLKDGTSMAAPHVSGAAALLMARYNELVGRPVRIKQILCDTATDLGREKYFQGAGMLDVLRALQSV
jgi:serine protease AprX